MFVPVIDKNQKPLMPTKPSRARRWIKLGKATPFFNKGVFCVRLNVEPSDSQLDDVVAGVDPGSKKEAFTVKSAHHTYLNVQADAVTHVSKRIKARSEQRRGRRFRKCPYRKNRINRTQGSIPPSTRARWELKLRILNWLSKIYPISHVVVEDIKAWTRKGSKRWNSSFSPLEVGKQWFYDEIEKQWILFTKAGYETKQLRDRLGLNKSSNKKSDSFEAHCVDSWVLANWVVEGHDTPDNKDIVCIVPYQFHRRQLHRLQPSKGGKRHRYGGTVWV